MPLRNRVSPFGEILAIAGRGTLTGNRGVLHTPDRRIVRDWQIKRWIACRLEFRGRHRQVMAPGRWTELFFLDEAVALADGHRPCAECRHADFQAFQAAWREVHPHAPANADAIDATLHHERRVRAWVKRTWEAPLRSLPDGAYVADPAGQAWLVWGDALYAWSPDQYRARGARPSSASTTVRVLTPESVIGVLRAGYRTAVHPSTQSE